MDTPPGRHTTIHTILGLNFSKHCVIEQKNGKEAGAEQYYWIFGINFPHKMSSKHGNLFS